MKTYLIDDHRRIFEAVVARDPERADAALREVFRDRRRVHGGGPSSARGKAAKTSR